MNALHAKSLRSFSHRLEWTFRLRAATKGATVWLFLWGIATLAVKVSRPSTTAWLAYGVLGILPVGLIAAWQSRKQRPAYAKVRASYDRLNACGGVIMSEEAEDMSAWQAQLPPSDVPKIRWRAGRSLTALAVSAAFVATTFLVPVQFTHFAASRHQEIGRLAEELHVQVQALKQEKILDDKKADDLQKQLSQIEADSSGNDPDKTWEALDHVKQSDSDAAKQAADEALVKTAALTQAQMLAEAMGQAADNGMSDAAAAQAAQELAKMLTDAKLQDGLLNMNLPSGPLTDLSGLNKEQLQKLLNSIQLDKESLEQTVADLRNLNLVDGDIAGQLTQAGQNGDAQGLAQYLASCKDGADPSTIEALAQPGKGGGGPAAPMTWSDPKSEENLKFQPHVLPAAADLSGARLMGVSRAAPKVSGDAAVVEHGALAAAQGSGGSANTQVILPEQRQAVRNFFVRDGQ